MIKCVKPLAYVFLAVIVFGVAAQRRADGQTTKQSHQQITNEVEWWKNAVIYEIYPRSFQDSNGDGIGDLNGITERLKYLKQLGVDAIWLTPINPSPQVDFGYDISDYESIDPQYGTSADFDRLIKEAQKQKIRVIMDMVMNHTSDKHSWFIESASSKTNPKRDWYIWRDGKAGGTPPTNEPTNWISSFGHSAWQYDPESKQYYYHHFYTQQPDLNWRNPEVKSAMKNVFRFWLNRGVSGFRLDAATALFEDPQLRDAKQLEGYNDYGDKLQEDKLYSNLPEVHGIMRELRVLTDSYLGNRVLIGETRLPRIEELDAWYGGSRHNELQLPMDMQVGFTNKLDTNLLRQRINSAETMLHGNEPLFVFDNHDQPRSWNRYGDGVHDEAIARIIATILLMSRDTVLMYYGQEIGMVTTPPTHIEEVKDPIGITGWPNQKGRDGERTPMQWSAQKNAGFSMAESTWLPVASDFMKVNVQSEQGNPNSLLSWYERLIALRRTNPSLRDGRMAMLDSTNPSVLAWVRIGDAKKASILVAVNCTDRERKIVLDSGDYSFRGSSVQTLLTDAESLKGQSTLTVVLPPYSSWVGGVQ